LCLTVPFLSLTPHLPHSCSLPGDR
jgi:hypothetical protein